MITCEHCGKSFEPKHRGARFCSIACANRGAKRRRPSGSERPDWKGDQARAETKRERAQKAYSLDGRICEFAGCPQAATDRHHVNEDTGDNRRENLQFLCRRHHMEIDGRLDALLENQRKQTERQRAYVPPPCVRCGTPKKEKRWHGRCRACAVYLSRTGAERPDRLIERATRKEGRDD